LRFRRKLGAERVSKPRFSLCEIRLMILRLYNTSLPTRGFLATRDNGHRRRYLPGVFIIGFVSRSASTSASGIRAIYIYNTPTNHVLYTNSHTRHAYNDDDIMPTYTVFLFYIYSPVKFIVVHRFKYDVIYCI